MTELTPAEQGYLLLPENPSEVPVFLARTDFTDEQAKRLQTLVNWVQKTTEHNVRPMQQGSTVEVLVAGEWLTGHVTFAHKGGLLEVETMRGTQSVYMKTARVRWPEITN
jgi:hypothetical protein